MQRSAQPPDPPQRAFGSRLAARAEARRKHQASRAAALARERQEFAKRLYRFNADDNTVKAPPAPRHKPRSSTTAGTTHATSSNTAAPHALSAQSQPQSQSQAKRRGLRWVARPASAPKARTKSGAGGPSTTNTTATGTAALAGPRVAYTGNTARQPANGSSSNNSTRPARLRQRPASASRARDMAGAGTGAGAGASSGVRLGISSSARRRASAGAQDIAAQAIALAASTRAALGSALHRPASATSARKGPVTPFASFAAARATPATTVANHLHNQQHHNHKLNNHGSGYSPSAAVVGYHGLVGTFAASKQAAGPGQTNATSPGRGSAAAVQQAPDSGAAPLQHSMIVGHRVPGMGPPRSPTRHTARRDMHSSVAAPAVAEAAPLPRRSSRDSTPPQARGPLLYLSPRGSASLASVASSASLGGRSTASTHTPAQLSGDPLSALISSWSSPSWSGQAHRDERQDRSSNNNSHNNWVVSTAQPTRDTRHDLGGPWKHHAPAGSAQQPGSTGYVSGSEEGEESDGEAGRASGEGAKEGDEEDGDDRDTLGDHVYEDDGSSASDGIQQALQQDYRDRDRAAAMAAEAEVVVSSEAAHARVRNLRLEQQSHGSWRGVSPQPSRPDPAAWTPQAWGAEGSRSSPPAPGAGSLRGTPTHQQLVVSLRAPPRVDSPQATPGSLMATAGTPALHARRGGARHVSTGRVQRVGPGYSTHHHAMEGKRNDDDAGGDDGSYEDGSGDEDGGDRVGSRHRLHRGGSWSRSRHRRIGEGKHSDSHSSDGRSSPIGATPGRAQQGDDAGSDWDAVGGWGADDDAAVIGVTTLAVNTSAEAGKAGCPGGRRRGSGGGGGGGGGARGGQKSSSFSPVATPPRATRRASAAVADEYAQFVRRAKEASDAAATDLFAQHATIAQASPKKSSKRRTVRRVRRKGVRKKKSGASAGAGAGAGAGASSSRKRTTVRRRRTSGTKGSVRRTKGKVKRKSSKASKRAAAAAAATGSAVAAAAVAAVVASSPPPSDDV